MKPSNQLLSAITSIILALLLTLISTNDIKAQIECDLSTSDAPDSSPRSYNGDCNNNLPSQSGTDYQQVYSQLSNWIPNSGTPIKTIEIAIHVFQNGLGGDSYQNTPSDIAFLQSIIDEVNVYHSGNCTPSDPIAGVVNLSDTKIRFNLGGRIFFYQDDALHTS